MNYIKAFICQLIVGDSTKFVYQFIYGQNDEKYTLISLFCFVLHALILIDKLKGYAKHMFIHDHSSKIH